MPEPEKIEPPTEPEIAIYRYTMMQTDRILRKPVREYTNEEVAASLLEIIPDTGGTALGEMRAMIQIANFLCE